jgi:hypothetical protein
MPASRQMQSIFLCLNPNGSDGARRDIPYLTPEIGAQGRAG